MSDIATANYKTRQKDTKNSRYYLLGGVSAVSDYNLKTTTSLANELQMVVQP